MHFSITVLALFATAFADPQFGSFDQTQGFMSNNGNGIQSSNQFNPSLNQNLGMNVAAAAASVPQPLQAAAAQRGAIGGVLANGNAVQVMTINPTTTIPNQVFVTSRIDNGNFGQTIVFSPRSGAQDYNVFTKSFTGMIAVGLMNFFA